MFTMQNRDFPAIKVISKPDMQILSTPKELKPLVGVVDFKKREIVDLNDVQDFHSAFGHIPNTLKQGSRAIDTDPENIKAIESSLRSNGFDGSEGLPTVVKQGNRYVIVDGHHRISVFRDLGVKSAPLNIVAPNVSYKDYELDEVVGQAGLVLNSHNKPAKQPSIDDFVNRCVSHHKRGKKFVEGMDNTDPDAIRQFLTDNCSVRYCYTRENEITRIVNRVIERLAGPTVGINVMDSNRLGNFIVNRGFFSGDIKGYDIFTYSTAHGKLMESEKVANAHLSLAKGNQPVLLMWSAEKKDARQIVKSRLKAMEAVYSRYCALAEAFDSDEIWTEQEYFSKILYYAVPQVDGYDWADKTGARPMTLEDAREDVRVLCSKD